MVDPVRFVNVTKRYGNVTALSEVNLTIEPGQVHCLVGPNGSGKTTLLNLLVGLTRPTSGEICVPNVPVGCSFQSPTFYPGLSVQENLEVFARLSGDPDDSWRQRVVDVFDLDRVGGQLAGTLSGGWQKKLDLALAFLKQPAYVLLDEPFGDLDDVAQHQLQTFLSDYCGAERTVLVVTHHVSAFEDVVDYLTVLTDGAIVFDGPIGPERTPHSQYMASLGLD